MTNQLYQTLTPQERKTYNRSQYLKRRKSILLKSHIRMKTTKGKYSLLLSCSKRRGVSVSISYSVFTKLNSKPCYYCGGCLPETGYGIDRVNSKRGYVIGNVRPCCEICNKAKLSMTEKQFRTWVLRVAKHWASK